MNHQRYLLYQKGEIELYTAKATTSKFIYTKNTDGVSYKVDKNPNANLAGAIVVPRENSAGTLILSSLIIIYPP